MNVPIYRAKKIDSDEYVLGWYSEPIIVEGRLYLSITNKDSTFSIDPITLAIHFPDMIDSQGKEIFASLGNIGGSVLTDREYEFNLYFDGRKYRVIGNEINSEINDYEEWKDFEVIGIQE